MKRFLLALASLKLTIAVLIVLLLGLAAGTIVESSEGTAAAGRAVYFAGWFLAVEAVFAANLIASIATLYPWGKSRAGYLTTHAALLVILAGALATKAFKVEGQLQLWEGETSDTIAEHDAEGRELSRLKLPFSIRLERFRVEHHPGTQRPSGFRSDVTVIEPSGAQEPAAVWMNHELEHRGFRFFQSSYRLENGRSATVLSVSKDPGQSIVFVGYGLLVAGMCTVLATRLLAARRRSATVLPVTKVTSRKRAIAASVGLSLFALPARAADLLSLQRLPVQHDGRAMPLDTLARESVWKITGARAFHGEAPTITAVRWLTWPQASANEPVVLIGGEALAAALGRSGATHASFESLVNDPATLKLLDQARSAPEGKGRPPLLTAAQKLEERLVLLQSFLNREAVRALPPADVNERWAAPAAMGPDELAALSTGPRLPGWPAPDRIELELRYNAIPPARLAWILLTAALLFSIAAWITGNKLFDGLAFAGLLSGFAAMTWGIATRWILAGRIPAANMYESMLFLGWGVGLFALVAFAVIRGRLVVLNANAMAALTMALVDLLPIDGFIHPVPPVLAGTPWLAIHVPIIMVSYSVLALGVLIAHLHVGFTIFAPAKGKHGASAQGGSATGAIETALQRTSDLLYWYTLVGSILLIAGILTGSIWAASSWGRYWGWDPKEVWSLVAFLAYIAILHARWEKLLSPFGVAALSIVAFQTILMTYLGVNFVLATGMHSYGMGDSPVVVWMIGVAVGEAGFLLWGLAVHRGGKAARAMARA